MSRRLMLRNASGGSVILPPEYQQVEWIGNPYNAFILTDFVLPQNCTLTAMFCQTGGGGEMSVIGCKNGLENKYGYQLAIIVNQKRAFSFAGASISHYFATGTPILSVFINLSQNAQIGYFVENGIRDAETSVSVSRNYYSSPIVLFRSYNKMNEVFVGRIFSVSVEDETRTQLFNLLPCYRKNDGEIGMYDTVSKTFYTNAGTGSFTKGADVN